jgi:hypothetical protein
MTHDWRLRMKVTSLFHKIETLIIHDKKFGFTIFSYVMVLAIFLNLSFINSPVVGAFASLIYFFINGIFLGTFFLKDTKSLYVRFMLGNFTLIMLLGTVAWLIVIVANIDVIKTTIVLLIVTTLCSFLNIRNKKNDERNCDQHTSMVSSLVEENVHLKRDINLLTLRLLQLAYLLLVVLSLYLLSLSRAPEVRTVWDFMHPAFMPVFFVATFVLMAIVLSREKTSHKLALISLHAILVNSFFLFIFPASGDVGGQQTVLGNARIVYENIVSQGFGVSAESPFIIPHMFMEGFLVVFTVIYARMFAVDVFWTHLLFMPVMWGIFVPLAAFMVTKALRQSEKVSVLSSMLVLLFPQTVIWGAISVPNSFGYVTTLWAMYFTLKYLSSAKEWFSFALAFCLISFFAHFLAGIISFSFLMFARVFRKYEREKRHSSRDAKIFLAVSFLFFTSLLPLSLPFVRFFTRMRPYFGLVKLNRLSLEEIVLLSIFGEYVNFSIGTALVYGVGEIIGFCAIMYFLKRSLKDRNEGIFRVYTLFLFSCFLMFLIDYRILKLLLVNPPFDEERLWLFQDFLALPFVAIAVNRFATLRDRGLSKTFHAANPPLRTAPSIKRKFTTVAAHVLLLTILSGLITSAVYNGYPHFGPLQTTSYEIEAAKYIHETTEERYIVICDLWFIYAGEIFYGVYNPHAFYFSHWDPRGTKLFVDMKRNPSIEIMMEATKYNNATTVYFVIEKPRLGGEEYNRIIQQAQQNGIQTYKTFYYQGEEKLRIFYYKNKK